MLSLNLFHQKKKETIKNSLAKQSKTEQNIDKSTIVFI